MLVTPKLLGHRFMHRLGARARVRTHRERHDEYKDCLMLIIAFPTRNKDESNKDDDRGRRGTIRAAGPSHPTRSSRCHGGDRTREDRLGHPCKTPSQPHP